MQEEPIRRSQLITPFGVGAMRVTVDGVSVIIAGLDKWYLNPNNGQPIQDSEFVVDDWRLKGRLHVNSLRLPPDYRDSFEAKNTPCYRLTVPVLRFPTWYFCPICKRLTKQPSHIATKIKCTHPSYKQTNDRRQSKPCYMSQVPFVAICPKGHITDFPFNEWVHKSLHPTCQGSLKLFAFGGGSLKNQIIKCDVCGASRSLSGITGAHHDQDDNEVTTLSTTLSKEGPFLCYGSRPWLKDAGSCCGQQLRGALRGAGNVYFPKVESSIYIPSLEKSESTSPRVEKLEVSHTQNFNEAEKQSSDEPDIQLSGQDDWRYPEYKALREIQKDERLRSTNSKIHMGLLHYLSRVQQVTTLVETRALRGFTRVFDAPLGLREGKNLLRRHYDRNENWLPACIVKGEGIYLELDPRRLERWEQQDEVVRRADLINTKFSAAARRRGFEHRNLTPRFILIHTLSHILINQLVFTCGYNSASLRERIYASTKDDTLMAGLLIYTAAGDSDGTLGGLVRMAADKHLYDVFVKAIDGARWCSTDPVCMDSGEHGQGPDSCNLAACHGCALLPETSCEEFNRFLDRGLLIGTFEHPDIGYFSAFPELSSNSDSY